MPIAGVKEQLIDVCKESIEMTQACAWRVTRSVARVRVLAVTIVRRVSRTSSSITIPVCTPVLLARMWLLTNSP